MRSVQNASYPRYRGRLDAANAAARERNRQYVARYLSTHPCLDCGNSDIRVLEFDHRLPKGGRRHAISFYTYRQTSLKRLQVEIDKCDVRCANCHRIKTSLERGWRARILIEAGSQSRSQNELATNPPSAGERISESSESSCDPLAA